VKPNEEKVEKSSKYTFASLALCFILLYLFVLTTCRLHILATPVSRILSPFDGHQFYIWGALFSVMVVDLQI